MRRRSNNPQHNTKKHVSLSFCLSVGVSLWFEILDFTRPSYNNMYSHVKIVQVQRDKTLDYYSLYGMSFPQCVSLAFCKAHTERVIELFSCIFISNRLVKGLQNKYDKSFTG